MGPIEKRLVIRLDIGLTSLRDTPEWSEEIEKWCKFIVSIQDSGSISVRQKWYLAFIASRNTGLCEYNESESDWINDVLSQDCPEGFPKKTPYWETKKATSPVLIGGRRKIRE